MKAVPLFVAGIGLSAILFSVVGAVPERLIWNRTGSVPEGLYWLSDEPFTKGGWVVVSARSAEAQWAEDHGFVGRNWPLLKQIAGLPGDEICRSGVDVSINGKPVAMARERDSMGRALPVWQGCVLLEEEQVFLLAPHPDSLDGRYFGAMQRSDLVGVARPLMTSDQ